MTVYAITDTKKGRTGIAPTYLQTTRNLLFVLVGRSPMVCYWMKLVGYSENYRPIDRHGNATDARSMKCAADVAAVAYDSIKCTRTDYGRKGPHTLILPVRVPRALAACDCSRTRQRDAQGGGRGRLNPSSQVC